MHPLNDIVVLGNIDDLTMGSTGPKDDPGVEDSNPFIESLPNN